jgi:hypothetical protein
MIANLSRRMVLVVLAISAVACDGGGSATPDDDLGDTSSTFARIQEGIFTPSCTFQDCHVEATRAGGLVLTAERAYEELIWVLPENPVARDRGRFRVAPGDPGDSYLLQKLTAALLESEGAPMPLGTDGLESVNPEKVELVRAWIRAGAPADGIVPGDEGGPLSREFPPVLPAPPAPAPDEGIQLVVEPYELPAGRERERCHYGSLPDIPWTYCSESHSSCQSDADCGGSESCIALLTAVETFMSPGSHHFFLFTYDGAGGPEDFPAEAVDTPFCIGFGPPDSVVREEVVGAQSPSEAARRLPDRVGQVVRDNQDFLFDTHFVNAYTVPFSGKVWVNLYFAKPEEVFNHRIAEGGNLDFNLAIDVPPFESRTTCRTWSPDVTRRLFFLSSHRHQTTDLFSIDFCERVDEKSGECVELGERIYESRVYNDPDIIMLPDEEDMLDVHPGQGLHYCCSITNDLPRMGCTGTQDPGNLLGITALCLDDSECQGLPGATGACEPQSLAFGFRAVDEMCILVGRYLVDESDPARRKGS